MAQHLQQLDLTQGGYREAVLLVVHQDLLQRHHRPAALGPGHGDNAKCAFTQFVPHHLVLANLCAAAEATLRRVALRRWGGRW